MIRLQHIETLNRLGQALSHCAAENASYREAIERLHAILGVPSISFWLLAVQRPQLAREVFSTADGPAPSAALLAFDDDLALWQKEHARPLVIRTSEQIPQALRRHPLPGEVISLPILHRESSLRGALNLYGVDEGTLLYDVEGEDSQMELFRGVAGQIAIFTENRSLEASSLLLKEIHHRVKNNLQTVASLLRLQMRRLDRISPEQALQDSINRIYAIAVVHERLSRADIGRVDFADLVRQLADPLTSNIGAGVTVRVLTGGDPVMLDSGDATSAALVANELIQNAIQHGALDHDRGVIEISVHTRDEQVRFEVRDNGAGLASGFDLARDSHLGLTIVTSLVTGELRGEFGLESRGGTRAWVRFPADPGVAAERRVVGEFPHTGC